MPEGDRGGELLRILFREATRLAEGSDAVEAATPDEIWTEFEKLLHRLGFTVILERTDIEGDSDEVVPVRVRR